MYPNFNKFEVKRETSGQQQSPQSCSMTDVVSCGNCEVRAAFYPWRAIEAKPRKKVDLSAGWPNG